MKNNNNKLLKVYLIVLSILFMLSCEKEEPLSTSAYYLGAQVTSDNFSEDIPVGQPNATVSGDFVVSAPENGQTVSKIDVSIVFNDVVNNGTDVSTDNVLLKSIPASELVIGESFRPEFSFETTLQEMLTTLSVDINAVDGSDIFDINFSVSYGDREVTSQFNIPVVCPSTTAPTPGTWELELREQWGDGWDSGAVVITIDSVATEYFSFSQLETVTFEVPNGASSLSVGYKGGNWDNENGFTLKNPEGKIVIDIAQGSITRGSVPFGTIAEQVVDYCAF